jgi:hypothetical protein
MKSINEEDRDHHHAEYGIFEKEHVHKPILQEKTDQDQRRDDLHQKVMPVNLGTTKLAFSTQDNVAKNRDIQIWRDGLAAISTMRCREDDRFFAGKSVDEDIKKAAQSGAKDSQENDYYASQD